MAALWILLGLLACFAFVLLIRAAVFTPASKNAPVSPPFQPDVNAAAAHLQEMLRLKTISSLDATQMEPAEFEKFQTLLPTLYPKLYAACEYELIGEHGILLRLPGKSALSPTVLMAHYDVVPADESEWEQPPFAGVIKDGELWGRGALDTKCTLAGMLEAAEALLNQGFQPERDIYFAFGGNEECLGSDAPDIVKTLCERGVRPALVLDEGGAIVQNVFPGVSKPAALIGIAEKGTVMMDLTASGKGGHASSPPAVQSAGRLARALLRLQNHPMPFTLTKPALELFDQLGRHSSFAFRIVFANLWCFSPLLDLLCQKSGGELNALVRTTCALTRLQASNAYNVLPERSKAGINLRVICGETIEAVKARVEKMIADPLVQVEVVDGNDPSPISPTSGEGWERVATAIEQTYPGVLVSPYLMLACSDSRHYCSLCDNVYRFSGMPLSKEQRGMIHNRNERIPLALLGDTVSFFARLIRQC